MATKVKQYSLEYFAKHRITGWDSTPEIVKVVSAYASNGNHHSEINYEGPAVFFAAALYAEYYKRGGGTDSGFFPTNMRLAKQMADWLGVDAGMTVLDPGAGFGALSWAVAQRGGRPIPIEWAQWINRIGNAAWSGIDVAQPQHDPAVIENHDFLDGYTPPPFDAVIVNPPFGKVFGHATIEVDFLERIADWSAAGTPVCALLPSGYFEKQRPKKTVEVLSRFNVQHEEDQAPGEFKPLTNVATTMYLLDVCENGTLYDQRARDTATANNIPAHQPNAPIEINAVSAPVTVAPNTDTAKTFSVKHSLGVLTVTRAGQPVGRAGWLGGSNLDCDDQLVLDVLRKVKITNRSTREAWTATVTLYA